MPRAFLIKKLTPGRDLLLGKRPWLQTDPENENTMACPSQSLVLESAADTRGSVPYDLSLKQKKEKDDNVLPTQPIPTRPSPSVIEFSPKIITSSEIPTPSLGVSLINPRIPSPEIIKPCAPLEPLNLNTPSNSRMSSWHRPILNPCMSYFPYYLPHRGTDIYNTPTPYIMPSGSSLISPTHLPLSPPRPSLRMEQLSPGLPGGRESSLYSKPSPPPTHLHVEFPTIRKHQQPAYHHSSWIHMDKEGSISPIPRSDSSDSGSSSINTNKLASIVSSSTGGGGGVLAGQAPRYQCADCNKSYSTYSGLSRHRQFHCLTQAKKSFNCKYCEKVYLSLGALKMHIRTHTLPCKCKLCGKAFSRPWLLQGHIRTHTGEKPFACQHCSRAFADRSNLRAHLQTHSDVKKYNCKACTKTFSRMSLLLKHSDGGCLASQSR